MFWGRGYSAGHIRVEKMPKVSSTMPGSGAWEDLGRGTRTCLPVSKANLKTEVSSLIGIVIISPTVSRSMGSVLDHQFMPIGCKKWRIPVHDFWNSRLLNPVCLNSV